MDDNKDIKEINRLKQNQRMVEYRKRKKLLQLPKIEQISTKKPKIKKIKILSEEEKNKKYEKRKLYMKEYMKKYMKDYVKEKKDKKIFTKICDACGGKYNIFGGKNVHDQTIKHKFAILQKEKENKLF